VELQPIYDAIEKGAQDNLTIATQSGARVPVTQAAKNAIGQADGLKQVLLDVSETDPATGKLMVPADKLRQLRQAWDEVAAQAKVYQGAQLADAATGKIHAIAADAIRDQLSQDFPNIAALNKEYSFWKNVEKVVGDTVIRREGQAKPMSRQIASAAGTAFGAVTGGLPGAVMGKETMDGLQALANSPMWKTVSAVKKAQLAKYIVSGNQGAVNFTIRQMLKGIGQETISPVPAQPSAPLQLAPALQ
jgi:hypothetical protein